MYEILVFLGPNELSVAERCPYNNYRGVRKERLDCTTIHKVNCPQKINTLTLEIMGHNPSVSRYQNYSKLLVNSEPS